ncbi:MAG: hypothetical protein KBD62_32160 [Kofleriaceae bacterium]|nr:hypothetical protein [Kofleriaceae bacterium]
MMGRPIIPHRLCAVWPDHGAATEVAKLDGRMFHVCPGCAGGSVIVDKAEAPRKRGPRHHPHSPYRGQVVTALAQHPGADYARVAESCGVKVGTAQFSTLKRVMQAMVSGGELRREGVYTFPRFWIAKEAA